MVGLEENRYNRPRCEMLVMPAMTKQSGVYRMFGFLVSRTLFLK